MADFLEGEKLVKAVRTKLEELGSPITPDEDAANELTSELFQKYWKMFHDHGALQWDHATTGALLECGALVIGLRKRVAELEAEVAKLKGK
jgi:hypothetical protein